jgi:dolichol-phosphate mannosyltransferase
MWILDTPVSGYTTLIVFMSAFAGIQLFVTGLIGMYIGYIFDEVKSRPIYIVKDVIDHEE